LADRRRFAARAGSARLRGFVREARMSHYNRIAGQSVERIAALSDGVFAVAMTLLVLDLHAPAAAAMHGEHDLLAAIWLLAPRLLVYMLSFLTLGIFWLGQQTQLNHVERSDRNLSWIHLTFLFAVTLMPFSTALMAEFIGYRTALGLYWLNILSLGVLLYGSWGYLVRANLLKPALPEGIAAAVCRRILYAQALYAVGAALCVYSTLLSLGVIVLLQLNYAVAPRLGPLARI
jgi:uncharacterized membrane protein